MNRARHRQWMVLGAVGLVVGLAEGTWAAATRSSWPRRTLTGSPCTGEIFLCRGTQDLVVNQFVDSSGGLHQALAVRIEAQCTGTQGSECTLRANGSTPAQRHAPGDGASTVTQQGYTRILCPKAGNDYDVRYHAHVTINNNGEVTASHTTVDPGTCRKPTRD